MQTQRTRNLRRPTIHRERQQVQEAMLPAKEATERFSVAHYPKGWEWDDEHGWLPVLGIMYHMDGLNGVKFDQNANAQSINGAITGSLGKGGRIILDSDPALGEDYEQSGGEGFRNWLSSYPCVGGRKRWCFAWETAQLLPGGEALWDHQRAAKESKRFRAWLRDHRVVEPMAESVLDLKMQKAETMQLERLAGRAAKGNPLAQDEFKAHKERIVKMRTRWVELFGEGQQAAAPAPTSGRTLKRQRASDDDPTAAAVKAAAKET